MEPTVDRQNQVIHAVAEVPEPFAQGKTPLPVGIFANARIEAIIIPDSYEIPEAALVNDSYFWTMSDSGKLEKVDAKRLQSLEGKAFVQPLEADDLKSLRRENALLKTENDILKKAAVILGTRLQPSSAK